MQTFDKKNLFILTGAPGSGKSSIINRVRTSGILCVDEYAREIISEQRLIHGAGVYDKNPSLFKELMLSRAIHNFQNAPNDRPVILDRGIPDLLAYSKCFDLPIGSERNAANIFRYAPKVFFAPSWEAIYSNDEERLISFESARVFGEDLKAIYTQLGYQLFELPLCSVEERIDFILNELNLPYETKT